MSYPGLIQHPCYDLCTTAPPIASTWVRQDTVPGFGPSGYPNPGPRDIEAGTVARRGLEFRGAINTTTAGGMFHWATPITSPGGSKTLQVLIDTSPMRGNTGSTNDNAFCPTLVGNAGEFFMPAFFEQTADVWSRNFWRRTLTTNAFVSTQTIQVVDDSASVALLNQGGYGPSWWKFLFTNTDVTVWRAPIDGPWQKWNTAMAHGVGTPQSIGIFGNGNRSAIRAQVLHWEVT